MILDWLAIDLGQVKDWTTFTMLVSSTRDRMHSPDGGDSFLFSKSDFLPTKYSGQTHTGENVTLDEKVRKACLRDPIFQFWLQKKHTKWTDSYNKQASQMNVFFASSSHNLCTITSWSIITNTKKLILGLRKISMIGYVLKSMFKFDIYSWLMRGTWIDVKTILFWFFPIDPSVF